MISSWSKICEIYEISPIRNLEDFVGVEQDQEKLRLLRSVFLFLFFNSGNNHSWSMTTGSYAPYISS